MTHKHSIILLHRQWRRKIKFNNVNVSYDDGHSDRGDTDSEIDIN